MGKIIAVINDKGGVSKTTTVANLGTALWLLGKKVLMIDTDKQCNLTVTMDVTSINATPNLLTWMKGKRDEDIPIYSRYDGLDFIPGNSELHELEEYLRNATGGDRYLGMRLALIKEQYDYILIDCAPGCTSQMNSSALEASDEVLIPMRSDLFSVTGRGLLLRKIEEIRDLGYNVGILGVLLTQFDPRTEMGKMVKEHYQSMEGMPLIPITIRKCEDCNKAPAKQQTVYEFNPHCTAADDYMRLAERIIAPHPTPRRKTWTPDRWGDIANTAYTQFIKNQ